MRIARSSTARAVWSMQALDIERPRRKSPPAHAVCFGPCAAERARSAEIPNSLHTFRRSLLCVRTGQPAKWLACAHSVAPLHYARRNGNGVCGGVLRPFFPAGCFRRRRLCSRVPRLRGRKFSWWKSWSLECREGRRGRRGFSGQCRLRVRSETQTETWKSVERVGHSSSRAPTDRALAEWCGWNPIADCRFPIAAVSTYMRLGLFTEHLQLRVTALPHPPWEGRYVAHGVEHGGVRRPVRDRHACGRDVWEVVGIPLAALKVDSYGADGGHGAYLIRMYPPLLSFCFCAPLYSEAVMVLAKFCPNELVIVILPAG